MREGIHIVRMPIDGTDWLVAEQDWDLLLASARAGWKGRVVRATPGRRVVHIDGAGDPVILKHFRATGVRAALKALLRGSPALREWAALRKARRLGLPVPRPIAFGERNGIFRRESFLLTEAFDKVLPLKTVLFGEDRVRDQARWELIREVARVLRQMHDAGVSQRDLHLGNILARGGTRTAQVFLVDLQRAEVGARVPEALRWRDLATLHGGCVEATLTDRLRLLKAYLAAPHSLAADLKSLVARLERRGIRYRFRVWRRRRRRCVRENYEFFPVHVGGLAGFARRASWNTTLERAFQEPEGPLGWPGVRLLKNSRTTTVALLPSGSGSLFVKRYNYQGLAYAVKDLFRSSRARRVWMVANSLRMRGIPTPLPHACLERRRFGFLLESYLITEGIAGLGLLELSARFREGGIPLVEKRRLAREIGSLVRRLHERGVSHRDLKGQNILIREEGGRFQPLLLDLDGVRLGRVGWREQARDLARLSWDFRGHRAVTRADRLRFLLSYLRAMERPSWKQLWREVARMECRAGWG